MIANDRTDQFIQFLSESSKPILVIGKGNLAIDVIDTYGHEDPSRIVVADRDWSNFRHDPILGPIRTPFTEMAGPFTAHQSDFGALDYPIHSLSAVISMSLGLLPKDQAELIVKRAFDWLIPGGYLNLICSSVDDIRCRQLLTGQVSPDDVSIRTDEGDELFGDVLTHEVEHLGKHSFRIDPPFSCLDCIDGHAFVSFFTRLELQALCGQFAWVQIEELTNPSGVVSFDLLAQKAAL